jgi:hypothetical protein
MESGEVNVRIRAPIMRNRVLHRLAGWAPPGLRAEQSAVHDSGAAEALRGHSLMQSSSRCANRRHHRSTCRKRWMVRFQPLRSPARFV